MSLRWLLLSRKCVGLCVAPTSFSVGAGVGWGPNETCCTNSRLSDSPCQPFIPWLVLSLRLLHDICHVCFPSFLSIHIFYSSLLVWLQNFLSSFFFWKGRGHFSDSAIQKSLTAVCQAFCFQSETQQRDTTRAVPSYQSIDVHIVHLYDGNNLLP